MGRRKGRGFVAVDGGVVGWISGGEPLDGCDVVSLMIYTASKANLMIRAREIGLWSPYVMDVFGDLDATGVASAVIDPEGFVWNDGRGGPWRPSAELVRPAGSRELVDPRSNPEAPASGQRETGARSTA